MAGRSISGTWRGHYSYYHLPDEGSGFDAIFIDDNGTLSGSILDDVAWLGEANILGKFSFPVVSFTKVYKEPGHSPIEYHGRMSDDGKALSGTWIINSQYGMTKGTWRAHRTDEEEKKQDEVKQSKIKERELDELLL